MKRRILSVLLAILLVTTLLIPVTAFAASTSSFDTEVRLSIASIDSYLTVNGSSSWTSGGTCFFIGDSSENPQYVVTNHHVVETFLDQGAGDLVTLTNGVNSFTGKASMRVNFDANNYVEAYIVDYDASADIAILRLDKPTDKRTALKFKIATDEMVGSTVYAVGYPSIADNGYDDPVSQMAPEDATVTTGSISRLLTTSGSGVKKIQVDAIIRHGNSGGPLVDENGNVLGVNTGGVSNASGEEVKHAVSIEEVIEMCDANAVPYMMAGESANMAMWIVSAAVAAVVVLAVILVLRKKKAAPAPAPVSVAAPASVAPAPAAPAAPVVPAAPASGNELRFQCTAGAFAGKRFAIDGTVRIGRDPSKNDLVYPGNTQGISGVHCILIMKDGTLYLQDLGSTYGTFINGGQRLAANQPVALKIGDRFTLGSDREAFVITPRGGL